MVLFYIFQIFLMFGLTEHTWIHLSASAFHLLLDVVWCEECKESLISCRYLVVKSLLKVTETPGVLWPLIWEPIVYGRKSYQRSISHVYSKLEDHMISQGNSWNPSRPDNPKVRKRKKIPSFYEVSITLILKCNKHKKTPEVPGWLGQ